MIIFESVMSEDIFFISLIISQMLLLSFQWFKTMIPIPSLKFSVPEKLLGTLSKILFASLFSLNFISFFSSFNIWLTVFSKVLPSGDSISIKKAPLSSLGDNSLEIFFEKKKIPNIIITIKKTTKVSFFKKNSSELI